MPWPLVSRDCLRFLVSDRVPDPSVDEGVRRIRLAWADETFAVRDTVTPVVFGHSHPMSNPGGYKSYLPVPWTTTFEPPVAGEDPVVGCGRRAELGYFAPDGRLSRIVRWRAEPDPITAEDRRRFEDEVAACEARFRETPRAAQAEGLCRSLDDFGWLPSHKFLFDELVRDPDGSIWARSVDPTSLGAIDSNYRGEARGPERWTVLASSGKWLGTVRMPNDLSLQQVAGGGSTGCTVTSWGWPRCESTA